MWVKCHYEVAKLFSQEKKLDEAMQLLLRLRHVLPPIDTSLIPDFTLPFNIDFYRENSLQQKFEREIQRELYIIDEDNFENSMLGSNAPSLRPSRIDLHHSPSAKDRMQKNIDSVSKLLEVDSGRKEIRTSVVEVDEDLGLSQQAPRSRLGQEGNQDLSRGS
eukprot:CAMPEP_0202980084 /NCGR_PEP_ID=MMETSP1396-20130829/86078_1 /ASSEMBLY_ACC=CAM_ASM_000872 /TAXON_ID= /ORGANISM="Pseudokeronopsis sp., Strain Brazil" /LENGTH=161 /DNA_ID=CAMNT_0049719841 /DNA_START=391 /DNA_END=876 /DNA_ORIENTATION=+